MMIMVVLCVTSAYDLIIIIDQAASKTQGELLHLLLLTPPPIIITSEYGQYGSKRILRIRRILITIL